MLKTGAQGEASELSLLLQQGRRAKDYSSLMAYLKSLTPSRLDSELRYMQVRHLQPSGKLRPLPDIARQGCLTP